MRQEGEISPVWSCPTGKVPVLCREAVESRWLLQDTSRIIKIPVLSRLLLQPPFTSSASPAPCFWDGHSQALTNWPPFSPPAVILRRLICLITHPSAAFPTLSGVPTNFSFSLHVCPLSSSPSAPLFPVLRDRAAFPVLLSEVLPADTWAEHQHVSHLVPWHACGLYDSPATQKPSGHHFAERSADAHNTCWGLWCPRLMSLPAVLHRRPSPGYNPCALPSLSHPLACQK